MADFARRCADEFAKDAPPPEPVAVVEDAPAEVVAAAPPQPRPVAAAAPIAAHSLLWAVIKAWFANLGRKLGFG